MIPRPNNNRAKAAAPVNLKIIAFTFRTEGDYLECRFSKILTWLKLLTIRMPRKQNLETPANNQFCEDSVAFAFTVEDTDCLQTYALSVIVFAEHLPELRVILRGSLIART